MEQTQQLTSTIASLTLSQAKLLHRLMYSPERTGFAMEQGESNPVSQLHKLGLVEKRGRVGTRHRWTVPVEVYSKGRQLVKEILAIERDAS